MRIYPVLRAPAKPFSNAREVAFNRCAEGAAEDASTPLGREKMPQGSYSRLISVRRS
jgi:hypothetical protein